MITPNRLTALRIVIAFLSPLLLLWNRSLTQEVLVFLAFTVACITDWWDGYLARTKSMVTWSGKIADPLADKLLIVGLMGTFSYLGLYSFWWVVPIFIRETVVTSIRLMSLKQGRVIPAEAAGKVKVGFQIASVYFTLVFLMILDTNPESSFLRLFQILHYAAVSLANVFTVLSGAIFFYRLRKT